MQKMAQKMEKLAYYTHYYERTYICTEYSSIYGINYSRLDGWGWIHYDLKHVVQIMRDESTNSHQFRWFIIYKDIYFTPGDEYAVSHIFIYTFFVSSC